MTTAQFKEHFTPVLNKLRNMKEACSEDMHEPDCQGVIVRKVSGRKLDNAYGAGIRPSKNPERRFLLVNEDTGQEEWFNLSDILALARKAKL